MTTEKANKITIYFCLLFTIVFEVVVAILVNNVIGDERMSISILRLVVQLIFLMAILLSNSRIPLYILTFYHVILGFDFFTKDFEMVYLLFGMYHILIGLMVYFNTEIDLMFQKLSSKS